MNSLTDAQLDVLQELLNIGVGRSAAMLNRMLNLHVSLQIPLIKVLPRIEILQELEKRLGFDQVSAVRLGFNGSFNGVAHLVFPPLSAAKLVAALLSEDTEEPDDLDALKTGALSEVGNVVLNGVMGEISNILHQQLRYSIPAYTEVPVSYLCVSEEVDQQSPVILAQAQFLIEQLLIVGDIILIFNINSFNILLLAIEDILEENYEEPSSY
jgi:chemotaxis protein CheC